MANCGILFEFGAFDDTIHCKIRSLKYWLRIIQSEQTKLRAMCCNYQSRNVDSRCWANEIRKGLEKNRRNVWRKVRRRFLDINQQEIMRAWKETKSLSLQKEIKRDKEPYFHVLG